MNLYLNLVKIGCLGFGRWECFNSNNEKRIGR